MFDNLKFFFLIGITFLQLYWRILVFKTYIILLKIHFELTEGHFLKMFSLFSPFSVFLRHPPPAPSINWKEMLLEKKNRYDQRSDYTLFCITSSEIHIYNRGLGLLPQNLIHYGDLDIVLEARAWQRWMGSRVQLTVGCLLSCGFFSFQWISMNINEVKHDKCDWSRTHHFIYSLL